jgi:prepilin-type N-terminal cleavage/methylation domain-containing protein
MRSLHRNAAEARSAFTLLELLVSSAIIGVMMLVLLSATTASLGIWRGSEQRIAVDREGRNALSLMADDLANILVTTAPAFQPRFGHWDNNVFMEFPVLRPRDYQDPAQANSGDVCYVRYRYNSGERRISRSYVDSLATFAAFSSGTRPPAATYEMLADNVTDLNINTYDAAGVQTTDAARVRTVSLSVGVMDKQEVENIARDISLSDAKTSRQFFSVNAAVPSAP